MKKTILSLVTLALLVNCDKKTDDGILPMEDQIFENGLLVGTWQAVKENSLNRVEHYVFTEDFKMSTYSTRIGHGGATITEQGYTNEPYIIPERGKVALSRLQNNVRLYRFSGESLYITDAWESEYKRIK